MSLAGVRAWAAARSPLEWLALVAAVACFGGIGWDAALWEPRLQLVLHLMAVGVIVGIGIGAFSGRLEVPVTRIDLPLLALVAAFALATVSALNVGMSLRALASIVAFALMLPAALIAIRHRPSWVGVITGGSVLLLSIPTLLVLLSRRVEWLLAGGPGLPPLRLGAEGTPFGSVAVPPFVIWPAWALAGLIEAPAWRRGIRIGLVAVGIPLTILSGSRSAWLAIAATGLVIGVPWLWLRRRRLGSRLRPSAGGIALAIGGVVAGVAVLAVVIPRLQAVTSLVYRISLWRDTLLAWSSDPLLGIGPGFMPIARQAAAPDFSFPVRQPHSHNLPLGLLGDAGIVGLVAGLTLVVALAWVAGPWRARTRVGWQAGVVLLGIGIAGLFEDITFEPNFNLLAIALVAVVLADAGAVRWTRLPAVGWRRPVGAVIAGVSGVILAAAMITADAGAIAYRAGIDRAVEGRWADASTWLARATEIDPWHPAGPKALAVTREAAADDAGALAAAERATQLNPGDAASWTNVAILCAEGGRQSCAEAAAERATATSAFGEVDQLNAARLFDASGNLESADDAYRRSLLSQRLTVFGDPWPRRVTVGTDPLGEEVGDVEDLNRLLAWWRFDEPIDPALLADPSARALAHAILDERADAEAWIARAIDERPEDPVAWQVATVVYGHWGDAEAARQYQRIGEVVSGRPYPHPDAVPAIPAVTRDLAVFRDYPHDELIWPAERLLIQPPMPWALEATLP
jgi:O-antigen ligase/tetratricopeptide (TPR) repeat protein